jgi:hypothetical protein
MLEASLHGALRLDPQPGVGGNILLTIGRGEIPLAGADFPLFLAKDGTTGTFEIAALVGLTDRNLFAARGGWASTYVPEIALSAPFRLAADSPTGLAIVRDDPRLGAQGDALFDAAGSETDTLAQMRERLRGVLDDVEAGRRMAADLVRRDLVRPVSLTLQYEHGTSHALEGLYTLDQAALAELPDAAVAELFRSGDLAAAILLHASLCQLERLRQLHNSVSSDRLSDVIAQLDDR